MAGNLSLLLRRRSHVASTRACQAPDRSKTGRERRARRAASLRVQRRRSLKPSRRRPNMAQLKIPLDSARFATGFTWKDYMAQMGDTRARTEENYQKSALTEDERKFFAG